MPPSPRTTRIIVLISGSGTNLQALISAQESNLPPGAKVVRVISNKKDAFGITRAQAAGIPTSYHNLLKYKRDSQYRGDVGKAREAYDEDLAKLVLRDKPHLVVCAGFMHILSPSFLEPLEKERVKIINLHPALRAQFNGANAIERAHAAFMNDEIKQTGVMIHYVISEVDMGQPILEIPIPLTHPEDDDLEALKERIHGIEHGAIVEGTRVAVEKIWEGKTAAS